MVFIVKERGAVAPFFFLSFGYVNRLHPNETNESTKGQQKVNNGSTDFGMRKDKRMASIKENRKKGKIISFKFRVFIGRDEHGRQQFRTKTWKPDKEYTEKRLWRLAEAEATLWEREIACVDTFEEEPIEISKIDGPIGEVVIRGKVIAFDKREIRNEKTIIIFTVTDFTDTISGKLFVRNEEWDEIKGNLKGGKYD